jgi:hypothetical protein
MRIASQAASADAAFFVRRGFAGLRRVVLPARGTRVSAPHIFLDALTFTADQHACHRVSRSACVGQVGIRPVPASVIEIVA